MSSIPDVCQAMEAVLNESADDLARPTGFIKRKRKFTGSLFVSMLVFTCLQDSSPTLDQYVQTAAALGTQVRPEAVDQRFSPEAAHFLARVFDETVAHMLSANEAVAIPLLQRFAGVVLQDSSVINLPESLSCLWRGCGDSIGTHQAGLKAEVRFDILSGTLQGPLLEHARTQDKGSAIDSLPVPAQVLRLTDLGYFSLKNLAQIGSEGGCFLTRLQTQTALYDSEGRRLLLAKVLPDAGKELDMAVRLGYEWRLPVRLLAIRVPQAVADKRRMRMKDEARRRQQPVSKERLMLASWTILVTNVPKEKLSVTEALALLRGRWQVELLFRLWKEHGKVDEWRSRSPWRIMCEVYAKFIAMVVQHWLILTGDWHDPVNSMVKAARFVRSQIALVLYAFCGGAKLVDVLEYISRCLKGTCRMNRRSKEPNTRQLLLSPQDNPHVAGLVA